MPWDKFKDIEDLSKFYIEIMDADLVDEYEIPDKIKQTLVGLRTLKHNLESHHDQRGYDSMVTKYNQVYFELGGGNK